MTIRFDDRASGYLRATVPFGAVRLLFEWPEIDAVRVDGLAAFDTRLQPQILQSSLGFSESDAPLRVPPRQPAPTPTGSAVRPTLTRELARRYPINTDQDMGVTELRAANPTFDGRGVGIGVLEVTGLPLDHPAYADAKALDGSPRRKVLRYLDSESSRAEGISAPFSSWFDCASAICNVQGRVLRLPAAGRYRLADFPFVWPDQIAQGGSRTYVVLEHEGSGRLYVDGNRDRDFLIERPLTDFNSPAWDARSIVALHYDNRLPPIDAVATVDSDGQFVRLHPFNDSHATMTSSVAAGSDHDMNLAVGVAPGASLVVTNAGPGRLLSQALEGAIVLARDKDVDLIFAALIIQTPLGTSDSFDARAFDRISAAYDKPVLISAGNYVAPMSATPAPSSGLTMTVGQYISSQTTEALTAVKRPELSVLASTVGPALDGAPRPDFIAATRRVAAEPCVFGVSRAIQNQFDLPRCYGFSAGTSAASPSAAGAAALLFSAAKQRQLRVSVREIREALIASARLMPGLPVQMQGAGLINVARAWEYLQHRSPSAPLEVEGELRHRFIGLLGTLRPKGVMWVARSGEKQTLTLNVRRPRATGETRLSLRTEGDLQISAPPAVTLETGAWTRVPVTIASPKAGTAASSWVMFSDGEGKTVARVFGTAARPIALSAPSFEHSWQDDVDFEGHHERLISMPPGVTGMLLEVDRVQGDGIPHLINPLSLVTLPRNHWSGGALFSAPLISTVQRYAGVLMNPADGDWGISTINRAANRGELTEHPERFIARMRTTAFRTACEMVQQVVRGSVQHVRVAVSDVFAKPVNGRVLAAPATISTERYTLRDEFERRSVNIEAKPGTAAFHVAGRHPAAAGIILQLFDCTQKHCIPVVQTVPGETTPALNVRQPRAGLWKVFAVSTLPMSKPVDVEVSVTQALESNLRTLARVAPTEKRTPEGPLYEGDLQVSDDERGLLLFRTDERAMINTEGWGAISVCSVQGAQSR